MLFKIAQIVTKSNKICSQELSNLHNVVTLFRWKSTWFILTNAWNLESDLIRMLPKLQSMKIIRFWRELWPSGYGRRLTFKNSRTVTSSLRSSCPRPTPPRASSSLIRPFAGSDPTSSAPSPASSRSRSQWTTPTNRTKNLENVF